MEAIMLAPIAVVFAILYTTHNFVLTIFMFHLALTILPLMFLRKKNVHIDWKSLLKQDLAKNERNLHNDLKLVAIPVFMTLGCWLGYRHIFPDTNLDGFIIPDLTNLPTLLLLFVEFVFINPIVEELFWRFFCDLFMGKGRTWAKKLDITFHFALYHWFVAYFATQDLILSTGGFFAVLTLGFILNFVKEKKGLITAMIIHLGVDLAGGLAIWDMQAKFLPSF